MPVHEDTAGRADDVQRPSRDLVNETISANLLEYSDLLEQQGADHFRVNAYRRASDAVLSLPKAISEIFEFEGLDGLIALAAVGRSSAAAIAEMVTTGKWAQLERLRGALEPEKLFQTLPGIGPELAERIYEELHVDTLEALEMAAHDGRLEQVAGIGRRRALMLQAVLSERLGQRRVRAAPSPPPPPVDMLLDIDRQYRSDAASGRLRCIAPRRFNPSGEAWLPVLHTRHGDWDFTALFSNTRRAHELRRTHEWVVIFYQSDSQPEGQCTVVTEARGSLRGKRVVRGREEECRHLYCDRADP